MNNKESKGFTLIELLVALLLMGIITSLATFSVRIIFDANVESYAVQFAAAVRTVRDQTLSSKQVGHHALLTYDSTANQYYYERVNISGTTVEKVNIPQSIQIAKEKSDGSKAPVTGSVVLSFDQATGKVTDATSAGTYWFTNTVTSKACCVHVVEKTGSVIVDE